MLPQKTVSLTHKGKFRLCVLVVLVFGAMVIALFSNPTKQLLAINARLKETYAKLLQMEHALQQQEQVESTCKQFEQRILATGTDAEELGFLLKELEKLTRIHNVTVKSIKPLPMERIGSYRKFLVSLEVEGRVQSMFELFHAVDSSTKILSVESLKMVALRSGPNMLGTRLIISRTSAGIQEGPEGKLGA